jgi:hypothetical protein
MVDGTCAAHDATVKALERGQDELKELVRAGFAEIKDALAEADRSASANVRRLHERIEEERNRTDARFHAERQHVDECLLQLNRHMSRMSNQVNLWLGGAIVALFLLQVAVGAYVHTQVQDAFAQPAAVSEVHRDQ